LASLVQGDVGLQMTLNDQQPLQAIDRVIAVMEQLGQVATRIGAKADQAVNSLGNTSEAVQGIRQIMEAQKAEEDAARKAAEAQRKHADELAKQKQAFQDMKAGLQQIAIAAAAMTYALERAAASWVEAYNQQRSAFGGLESVANRTIGSFQAAKDAANSFAEDGLASIVNYSKALQDYLTVGYSLDDAKELIQISKDAATYNRQMGLSIGEAVERMAQGVKQGNSVVSDAAGITKNLSMILKEQGYSEQDLQRVQSDSAVRQALLNGLRREGAIYAGNAAKASKELSGSEAQAATAAFNARAALGESLAPAVQGLYDAVTPLIKSFTSWAQQNPELARTMFLVVAGAIAMTGAVTTLTIAVIAFHAALGPVGWALVGISAALGGFAGYMASVASSGQAASRTQRQLGDLVDEYNRLQRVLDDSTKSTEDHQKAEDELRKVLEQIKAINPDLVDGLKLQQTEVDKLNAKLQESIDKSNKWAAVWIGIRAGLAAQAAANGQAALAEALLPTPKPINPGQEYLLAGRSLGIKPATPPNNDGGGGTGGGDKMSPALAAAMEDLQDLQSLDKNADNLRKTLEKVRSILNIHAAELKKLGKDRDLIRLRDITLPNDILQADFQSALQGINAKEQLKEISPSDLKDALSKLRTDFANYLRAHPDEDLQLQLRIKGASEEEVKAPFEAWRKQFQQSESMGLFDGREGLKLGQLRQGLSLAIGAKDGDAIAQITGQIQQLEKAIQAANFAAKFNAIAKAREAAFAGAAGQLAELNRQLIDEQAKGDKADPSKIKDIQQQMLDAVRHSWRRRKPHWRTC
jgi:predicted nuclease with TOPRIM domain